MRITSILLLTFILLLSCKKDSGIPDNLSFLIGEWRCYDCQFPMITIIKEKSITFNREFKRDVTIPLKNLDIRYDNITSNNCEITINKRRNIYLFCNTQTSKDDSIQIEISTNESYIWKGLNKNLVTDWRTHTFIKK